MISIGIDNKLFKVKTLWSELTVEDCKRIDAVEIPPTLKAVYDARTEEEVKTAIGNSIKNPEPELFQTFFREVLKATSNADPELIDQTVDGIEVFYFSYSEKFVADLYNGYPATYTPDKRREFEHKGKRYLLPKEEDLLNDKKPFADVTVEAFIEGLELKMAFQESITKAEWLNGLVAVFTREEGEQYSEEKVMERVEAFRDLPMNIVWDVFFCLLNSLNGSGIAFQTYLPNQTERRKTTKIN